MNRNRIKMYASENKIIFIVLLTTHTIVSTKIVRRMRREQAPTAVHTISHVDLFNTKRFSKSHI